MNHASIGTNFNENMEKITSFYTKHPEAIPSGGILNNIWIY